ncbi:GNAT family N-acetyltransferase [Streptomyces sp. NPDC051940]|uniref:GNAT family N-acetyltransferase n=1 Tax=Streptomyces sp. NPDC051940 TaxID=3155675 RepID=UPI00341729F1
MRIRTARADELKHLQDIERAADALFRDIGMPELADGDPHPLDDLANSQRQGLAWVAVTEDDTPVAFLTAEPLDGNLHVEQLSVHPSHARKGIGRHLLDHAAAHASASGTPALTLTTCADVPWNAPYYTRCGFHPLPDEALGPSLRTRVDNEAANGLARWARVCMRRPVDPSGPA